MRQRLFYKPRKKWPRSLLGAAVGLITVLLFLKAGIDPGDSTQRLLLPLALSIPAGAVGGYLFALLDPIRAQGHGFIANILGGAIFLALLGAAAAAGP